MLAAGVKIPRKPVAAMPHPLRAEPGAPENVRPAVSFKDFKTEPEASELEAKALQRIGHFDDRWERAVAELRKEPGWGLAGALQLLRAGAEAYGFWSLSDEVLRGLAGQLVGEECLSLGLQQWLQEQSPRPRPSNVSAPDISGVVPKSETEESEVPMTVRRMTTIATSRFGGSAETCAETDGIDTQRFALQNLTKAHTKPGQMLPDWRAHFVSPNYFLRVNLGMQTLVFVASAAYALDLVLNKYPKAMEMFSWPIFFARLGGMGCAICTALLFLSMSRAVLSGLSRCLPRSNRTFWFTFLDSQKDLHIEAGKALVFYSVLHVVGHCIGTVPGILQKSAEELNALLGCAQEDPPYMAAWDLSFLHWPHCPLTEADKPMNFTEALFLTMPGVTGAVLCVLLGVVGLSSRSRFRAQHFDAFWNLHNFTIALWPPLLFLHGSQGWIGVGMPLVVVVAALPMACYALSRLGRLLRYYLFAGRAVRILRATIRLGKRGEMEGSLTQLEVSPPPCLWKFHAGMYAFICMPDYAPLQWHPFTITSGKDDATVNFIIAGVGDWTVELARRCSSGHLPRIALDGPFTAPTQSAMDKKVLVAVGAGVGVTPFLSLLSTLIAQLLTSPEKCALVEAHFYWITRDPCEFIFGWQLLRKWLSHDLLQSKIFVHLHITAKDPLEHLPGFLFREALRRQSAADRHHFQQALVKWQALNSVQVVGPQFPWCWAEGGWEELLWVQCPSWDSGTGKFRRVQSAGYCSHTEVPENPQDQRMIPITLGRPNFCRDIGSIGRARPDLNIHVYICGNEALVSDLQSACVKCAQQALSRKGKALQQYLVHFERFG
ncbi:unnamed protein product [Effrenium voratum]|nr:unnamed protein product [Effrenium voratum]